MPHIWVWEEERAGAFLEEAQRVFRGGGVLAVPTETFYALAVNPFNEAALARVFAMKARPPEKPLPVLIPDPETIIQVARTVSTTASQLMALFWPGPLTLILPARSECPTGLTAGTGTVGVRQPRQPLLRRTMRFLELPVTGTSANRTGQSPLTEASEVAREFGETVDLILDAGPCPGGLPSTVVDLTVNPPRLVRAGAIAESLLNEIIPFMRY
jgi:L-threonylcarbamoyladenylate synthase